MTKAPWFDAHSPLSDEEYRKKWGYTRDIDFDGALSRALERDSQLKIKDAVLNLIDAIYKKEEYGELLYKATIILKEL